MEEGHDEPEPGDAGESDRRGSSSFHRDRTPTPSHGFQPGLPLSTRLVPVMLPVPICAVPMGGKAAN